MKKASEAQITENAAKKLKSLLEKPEWANFVKTGMHKERPPEHEDWWYLRAASILRRINTLGPIGVSKLRAKYGGKKNRGVKKEHTYRGSGKIIRTLVQDLEKKGFVEKAKAPATGRIITVKGKEILFKGL
ncbi:MAG: 30S ribosomal protein S19e [Nanoarchaeota archaeon]|nr:30S ribosomal protein S19e [Nanoarchaeota archaeon]